MPRYRRGTVSLLIVLTLGACGPNWHPATLLQPRPLGDRSVLEFRVQDTIIRLHAVRFERDSVTGVPWLEHTSCDSCRVRFAIADISEARIGSPGMGAWNIMLPFVVIIGFLYLGWSQFPST
jgi:hypothetical protein